MNRQEELEDLFREGIAMDHRKTSSDKVNHPSHYCDGKIEVIEFIEDKKLDFHLANAVKYICRAGKKEGALWSEDIEKAIWYLERYLIVNSAEDKE